LQRENNVYTEKVLLIDKLLINKKPDEMTDHTPMLQKEFEFD